MLLHTEAEIYRYYSYIIDNHLYGCKLCDMDNSCNRFDTLIAERRLKLLTLSIQGYVIIK